MRQWYSRLFGDTTTFGLRVSFGTDAGRRALLADDVEASWGSLELWADGRCLTRSTDSEGATHDGVVWHLLPLLEWFAESSRSLLNEEAFPSNITRRHVHDATEWLDASESPGFTLTEAEEDRWMERRSDWRQRHAPRAGMQDAAFPMLLIRRVAHSAEISWDNERWGATRRG